MDDESWEALSKNFVVPYIEAAMSFQDTTEANPFDVHLYWRRRIECEIAWSKLSKTVSELFETTLTKPSIF